MLNMPMLLVMPGDDKGCPTLPILQFLAALTALYLHWSVSEGVIHHYQFDQKTNERQLPDFPQETSQVLGTI